MSILILLLFVLFCAWVVLSWLSPSETVIVEEYYDGGPDVVVVEHVVYEDDDYGPSGRSNW